MRTTFLKGIVKIGLERKDDISLAVSVKLDLEKVLKAMTGIVKKTENKVDDAIYAFVTSTGRPYIGGLLDKLVDSVNGEEDATPIEATDGEHTV